MTNIDPQVLWIAGAIVAALVIILAISAGMRRSRSERLRDHFGSEYDRTVRAAGSRSAAEEQLVSRAEEVKTFDIRPLSAAERDRYTSDWTRIEQQFVNRPTTAVVEADELITDVMRTRGYPMADFQTHAEHLSVKHPRVVEHYRAGHALIDKQGSTEDLRQAMLHYRALFDELVNEGVDVERAVPREYETSADRERRRLFTSGETRDEDRPV
ncbi:MAG TPA: hypothetical protein VH087_02915 [Thermoanaerobaculia bacterium]|nr:hypothetical protein [Thermoanaerobaculia bacterium]